MSVLVFDRVILYMGGPYALWKQKIMPFSRLLNRAQIMRCININTLKQETYRCRELKRKSQLDIK